MITPAACAVLAAVWVGMALTLAALLRLWFFHPSRVRQAMLASGTVGHQGPILAVRLTVCVTLGLLLVALVLLLVMHNNGT